MRVAAPITDDDLDLALPDAIRAGSPDDAIAPIQAAIDDPTLRADDFPPARARVVISELQRHFGRMTEAEATLRAAVAADVHDDYPAPAAWLASLLVDTNRSEEAASVFADLKRAGRADEFAHEIYSEALEAAGDHDAALKIFAAGELLAERADNPWQQRRLKQTVSRVRAGDGRDPMFAVPALSARLGKYVARDQSYRHEAAASVLFWPRADHAQAAARWPKLADERLARTWDEHRADTERALTGFADEGLDTAFAMADIDEFTAYITEHGPNPPTGATLDAYATASKHAVDLVPWPPADVGRPPLDDEDDAPE